MMEEISHTYPSMSRLASSDVLISFLLVSAAGMLENLLAGVCSGALLISGRYFYSCKRQVL